MNQLLRVGSTFLGVFVFLIVIGFGIGSSKVAPDNAVVFINASQNTYIAPPCIARERWALYPRITIEQAYRLKLNPEPKCRDDGGFVQEGRSLTGSMFEKVGLLSPLKSRWNLDGTWNW